ncbi:YHS domain-containing (seleno)protein [Lutibaculum baratangense]|uniref:YHS domain-containing protein n=1 Tax=Lutibaculum baratangense AMV1 TaxID=631454 RepID=V4QSA9_9HYPH|nr:YHS domain-containing (seleno)protein [Lutibaculum baratangense]ESR22662.1 hypothetical protein N177_3799 [Lutibaculum baratangense AMV1]
MYCLARVLVLAALIGLAHAPEGRAGLAPDIVGGAYSGFAIGGHDPVSYFAGRATTGSADHQAMWGGVGWRFVNEGNREAFLRDPEVYVPAFGGHCATALARGERVEGDPRLFALHRGRVYLFHSAEARARFLKEPDRMAASARAGWARVAPHAPAELSPAAFPTR